MQANNGGILEILGKSTIPIERSFFYSFLSMRNARVNVLSSTIYGSMKAEACVW